MTTTEVPVRAPATAGQRRLYAILIVLAIGIAGLAGYGIRMKHDTTPQVSVGTAYLGDHQGGMNVGGVPYGFPVNDNDVTWIDARGNLHDTGYPPCMRHRPGYAKIRFGHAEISLPGNLSMSVVTWVQCIP